MGKKEGGRMTATIPEQLITRAVAESSLEWKLTSPRAFGLTTASPLQRAICRIADGLPLGDLADHPTVQSAIGNVRALPEGSPLEMLIISGIRTAKSLIAACGAFHMATSCDVSALRPGEIPRVSVVSLKKDLADVIMNHLVGSVKASPALRTFLMGEPSGDGLLIRHPSGVPVEVCVVAGSRAGSSLVARWSAGCIFDEFPRMVGGDDAIVNWDDQRQAVVHRLLKGAKLWHIGSPAAPYGPAYEMVTEHWGKPTRERVVIRAPAPAMNPVFWTPERVIEARAQDHDAARTDIDAEFMSPDEAMFSLESVTKCTRREPMVIEPREGYTYFAAMDPATRGNGWTMCIATRENGKTIVVRADEWIGSRDRPLDPAEVLEEAASILAPYRVRTVHSDQVMGDALVSLARQVGISLAQWRIAGEEQARRFLAIRTQMDLGRIEFPPTPHLRTDLLHVRKRVTPTGIRVDYPITGDGRHCDFGPALMLVLTKLLPEPEPPKKPTTDPETERVREAFLARFRKRDEW
jgi:hypothetical protein